MKTSPFTLPSPADATRSHAGEYTDDPAAASVGVVALDSKEPALHKQLPKGVAGMQKRIVGFASTILVTGAMGLAGLGLAPSIAQAQSIGVRLDDDHDCPLWVRCDWWHPDWQPQWWQPGWWQGDQGNQGGNQQ